MSGNQTLSISLFIALTASANRPCILKTATFMVPRTQPEIGFWREASLLRAVGEMVGHFS